MLERGEIANSRRTERWDSLRLLTPNWMSRLPAYAGRIAAPGVTRTIVTRVAADGGGYRVTTDRGDWLCRALVLATGAFNVPVMPRVAEGVPAGVTQATSRDYRHPGQLESGGVLVVGASATGLQLAHEIRRSGRRVTLAVGEHVRMPRTYRGRDIQWWMLESGVLDQRIEDTDDPVRARRVPSPQIVGTPERATLALNALAAQGVDIVCRLAGSRDGKARFSGSLRNACTLPDLKMNRLLELFDEWATARGIDAQVGPPERHADTGAGRSPRPMLNLGHEVRTIVWATGFRPDYSWLDVPVLDRRGELRHGRGCTTRARELRVPPAQEAVLLAGEDPVFNQLLTHDARPGGQEFQTPTDHLEMDRPPCRAFPRSPSPALRATLPAAGGRGGGAEQVGLPWRTVRAFVRIATDPRVLQRPPGIAAAIAIVGEWLARPAVILVDPADGYWSLPKRRLVAAQVSGPLVTDTALAALAFGQGARLCTTDRDFARLRGLKLVGPLVRGGQPAASRCTTMALRSIHPRITVASAALAANRQTFCATATAAADAEHSRRPNGTRCMCA